MIRIMTQLSVHTRNRLGVLAKLTKILLESDVNIVAISAPDTEGKYGTLRIVPDIPDPAKTAIAKIGLAFTPVEVIVMELPHRPGALSHVAGILTDHKIEIRYAYASILPGAPSGLCILRVDDMQKAKELLAGELEN